MVYQAATERYEHMTYNRVGHSGLKLSAVSLGLWHNFGDVDPLANQRAIIHHAFDLGITSFDMANNYGPVGGSAEENFGTIYAQDLKPYRDEMVITSKAGYHMWNGPYGEWDSRKHIVASCDQSLRRTGLDYFDIFYSHRPDPDTPIEETAAALGQLVQAGKALYIGISNYSAEQTAAITRVFVANQIPYIIHQVAYNMFTRKPEQGLFDTLKATKRGAIVFSPLAQGLLTGRYLNGIPVDSRAQRPETDSLQVADVEKKLGKIMALNDIAKNRGQSLAEMALAWDLRDDVVASVLVGASRPAQLDDDVKALANTTFTADELAAIDQVLAK